MISLEKGVLTWQFPVNKVIKSRPCWEAPYLWLVTYWQLTLSDCFRKWWAEYRNTGAYSRCSLPFSPFSRFSPSPHPLPFLHLTHRLVSFGLAIFNGILTCYQAFLLPFSFWRLREKGAWYFKHCLSVVQNLDFCLIGGKTKDASKVHTDWLQASYLTSGPIRLVFPPPSLFDETTALRNCFNRMLIGLRQCTGKHLDSWWGQVVICHQ